MSVKEDVKVTEEMKLEKEIAEKQEKLHKMRYGEMEKAYEDFEAARDVAIENYDEWRKAALKHGRVPQNIWAYFARISF